MENLTELAKLRTLVTGAALSSEAKHSALWCLDGLPKLYAELRRTGESRYWDSMDKICQAVLKRMGEEHAGHDAGKVSDAVNRRPGEMRRRLGIAPLALKNAVAPSATVRRKKAVVDRLRRPATTNSP